MQLSYPYSISRSRDPGQVGMEDGAPEESELDLGYSLPDHLYAPVLGEIFACVDLV